MARRNLFTGRAAAVLVGGFSKSHSIAAFSSHSSSNNSSNRWPAEEATNVRGFNVLFTPACIEFFEIWVFSDRFFLFFFSIHFPSRNPHCKGQKCYQFPRSGLKTRFIQGKNVSFKYKCQIREFHAQCMEREREEKFLKGIVGDKMRLRF